MHLLSAFTFPQAEGLLVELPQRLTFFQPKLPSPSYQFMKYSLIFPFIKWETSTSPSQLNYF